jgi:hypothetical protein
VSAKEIMSDRERSRLKFARARPDER